MSWLSSIGDLAKTTYGWFRGDSTGASIARMALTGYVLSKVSNSINEDDKDKREGSRIQLSPDTKNSVPIVYGKATVSGIVIDAKITGDYQTMYFCLALSEVTGTKLSDSAASNFTFKDIYWNDEKLIFKSDGITANSAVDSAGISNTDCRDKIQVYCYKNGSSNPVVPYNYTNASLSPAYSIFPDWTANHTMSDLVFVIVKMTYSDKQDVTNLGDWKFVIENSMTLPGDCLYDYMTNTRYGAGIDPTEVYSV
jgi:hypothetical protein